ncbi:MAG: glycosyltransferase family 2 protein [Chitinispirillaceae bacterium]|nr:glycosyltransferase family 2 protein [Chitinispirillaceae bacterium]
MSHSSENLLVFVFWFFLSAVAYSYCLYPLLLKLLAGHFGLAPRSSPDHTPSVGVVIPVYNEEKIIAEKLVNLFSVDYPSDKLSAWIGSDCSTDRTDNIVGTWNDPRVHLWRAAVRNGKACVLNQLVPMVDAEIVLFTDADILLDCGSIRALVRNFVDPVVGGAGGITLQRRHGQEVTTEETVYRIYEAGMKALESSLHSTISAFGSFYAVRKKLFMPFHPYSYSNDDVMMPMNVIRQGYRMCFDREAISYEEAIMEMKIEFRRRIRIGAGNFQAFFWLLDFLNPKYGWPWFCYVSHKVSRWFSPLFICASAAACTLLALGTPGILYKIFFIAGVLFVITGLLHRFIPLKFPRGAFYFMVMNAALVIGLFRFLAGIRSAVWSRTERPQ